MADLNTNALYQMIQDNATQAEGIKTAAISAPTFESQFGNTLREQDKTLSGAISGYGDKVAELFAHDKYVADNWSKSNVPTTLQPEGFVENPFTKSQASATLYAQKGKEVGESLKTLETRKAVLGDLVDKAMKMYSSAVEGKKVDYEMSKQKFADTLSVLKFQEDKRHNIATETDVGSATDIDNIKAWADVVETNGLTALSKITDKGLRTRVVEYLSDKGVPILDTATNTKKQAYDNVLSAIDQALAMLEQGDDISGGAGFLGLGGPAGSAIIRNIKKKTGSLSPRTIQLEGLIGNIAAGEAFGEAGKALTGTEREILGVKIPEIKLDERILKQSLEEAKRNALKKKETLLGAYAKQASGSETKVGEFTVKIKE